MNTDDRIPEPADREIRAAFRVQRSRITAHVDARRGLDRIKEPSTMPRRALRPALGAAAIAIAAIGFVLILQPFGGTEDIAGPTTTVTSTTIPATTIVPPVTGWEDARYRVVGVAAGDVLNVRERPGASNPIIGTLPPDGRVRLSSWPSTVDGAQWYGVMLDDDTQGFVNGAFLAPPESWDTGFTTLACSPDDGGYTTEPARGPEPTDVDAGYVLDVLKYDGPDCERYVIVFGSSAVRGGLPDVAQVAASSWPTDAVLSVDGSIVEAGFPGIDAATPWTQTVEGTNSFGLATREPAESICNRVGGSCPSDGERGSITMRFFFDSNRRAHYAFLTNPARIVIDVKPSPTGSGLDVAARRGGTTVVLPIQVDVNGPGIRPPITVTGWGRPFEAAGVAVLRAVGTTPGSGTPVEATFTGTDFAGTRVASTYPYMTTDYIDAWGAFNFTIEDVAPGTYELFVGELSMEDGSELGVYQAFTVAP
jgi:hypothetical protein